MTKNKHNHKNIFEIEVIQLMKATIFLALKYNKKITINKIDNHFQLKKINNKINPYI